jgi:predicted N-acetyltransferase YhbS
MRNDTAVQTLTIRPLTREDLGAVVAIDTALEGYSRRTYVERRLAAALREPALHAQFAACDESGVAGYILARVLAGEFGLARPSLRLELVGIRPDVQRHGAGAQLFEVLAQWANRHGMGSLHTSAHWANVRILGWLHGVGFRLAPEVVLVLDAQHTPSPTAPEVTLPEGHGPGHETDFGAPEANDHDRMARGSAEIAPMAPEDLREIVRIDRAVSGRDRTGYIGGLLAEATETSRTRVSLVARLDGAIVGFVMARADIGDFGRAEPVAVLDTIGVDPEYARRGIGRALVERLFENLSQLQVERIEGRTHRDARQPGGPGAARLLPGRGFRAFAAAGVHARDRLRRASGRAFAHRPPQCGRLRHGHRDHGGRRPAPAAVRHPLVPGRDAHR